MDPIRRNNALTTYDPLDGGSPAGEAGNLPAGSFDSIDVPMSVF